MLFPVRRSRPVRRLPPGPSRGQCLGLVGLWLLGLLTAGAAGVVPRMLLLDGTPAGNAIIAVGERGTVVRSTDRGTTWQNINTPTRTTLTGVSFAPDGRHGWAVGHDALILGSSDGGVTWTRQYQGENVQDSFLDIVAIDASHAIAVGAYGLFVSTTDGGRTWERRPSVAGDFHLNRITRGPTGTLYLAGESGTLLRSSDGGRTWTGIRTPYEGSFYGVTPLGASALLAYGLRGHLYRSADDGAHWAPVAVPEPVMLATAATAGSMTWFAGQARTLLVSGDAGSTVTKAPEPPATAIAELLLVAPDLLLGFGEAGVMRLALPAGNRLPSP
jgi:photosystem II stability/assembly factor-like uncharacterized protein